MRKVLRLALAVAVLVGAQAASAQDRATTGSLGGTVKDANGAAVVNAAVTVTGPTGTRTATTNDEGAFDVQGLIPGLYNLKVEQQGFKTATANNVEVFVGRQSAQNLTLEPGLATEVIEVTDAAATDLSSTAVGQNLSDRLFQNIPVQRSVSSLFYLSPGATDSINGGRDNPSIAGASALDNLYVADGVNITDAAFGGIGTFNRNYGSLGTGINTSFIKEVQVKTGGFEPQYGQSQGGIVNIITQSGSNEYHGALYGFARPGGFEATRRQADDVRVNKQGKLLHEENYDVGADFGGYVPGAKDKLFFFGSFNPTIKRNLVRGAEANASDAAAGRAGVVTSRLATLLGEHAQRYRTLNYAGKLDWNINSSHALAFSIFGDPTKTNRSSFRTLNIDDQTGLSRLEFGTRNTAVRYNGALSPTWTLSGSFSQGKNHFNETEYDNSVNLIQVRLPVNPLRGVYSSQGLGFVEPTDSTNYRTTLDTTKQVSFWGTHTFGAGYQYQRSLYSGSRLRSGPRYAIPAANATGTPLTTLVPGSAFAVGQMFNAQFRVRAAGAGCTLCPLLAVPGVGDVRVSLQLYRGEFGPEDFNTRSDYHAGYVQDTWRVNKYITAVVGLRAEQERLQGSPDATTGRRYSYTFTDQWAPRLGVTVDPFGRGKTKAYYNFGRFFEYLPLDAAERSLSRELDFLGARFAPDFTVDAGGVRRARLAPNGSVIPVIDAAHLLSGAAGGVANGITLSSSDLSAIAPGTKLGFSNEHIIGFEQQLPRNFTLSVRYQDRRLKRIIEDAAILSPEAATAGLGQTYFIGNISSRLDAATNIQQIAFSPVLDADGNVTNAPAGCVGGGGANATYVFVNSATQAICLGPRGVGANGFSINNPDGIPDGFVDPVRVYRAVEFELNKRFAQGWQLLSNFRIAKLKGNYEGHLRNDNGQTDPGISSLFDFSAGDFNLLGDQFAVGPLNTDRKFVSNVYGNYTFSKDRPALGGRFFDGLTLGAGVHMESGVPVSEFLPHPVYLNAGEIPVGGRGALGRTPFYAQLDLHADYPVRLSERTRLSLIADFFNVTNSRRLRYPDQFRQLDLGEPNPDFLRPSIISLNSAYRLPFSMRLGARFEF
ncbi:MAG TPA: TonB-dependent receptor [Pyrinomonadaceae bacterium]|jgi:hypothetical protein